MGVSRVSRRPDPKVSPPDLNLHPNHSPQPLHSRRRTCWWHLLVALALLGSAAYYTAVVITAESSCNSGILQLKANAARTSHCFWSGISPPSACLGRCYTPLACVAGLRVRIENGIVKIVPLEQQIQEMGSPGDIPPMPRQTLDCKDSNASGRLHPGSTTSASVMLFCRAIGPFLVNLTKTGPEQISLTTGRPIPGNPMPFPAYNYTVTEGCVLGVKAPTWSVAACPAGFVQKTGRFRKSYCAPCPLGTYASQGGSACKPCAAGMYSDLMAATSCTQCQPGDYAPERGSSRCQFCDQLHVRRRWTDGIGCYPCPDGSFSSGRRQCFKCRSGRRCCTVGWDQDCPRCADDADDNGADGSSITSAFALESASPSSCLSKHVIPCAAHKFGITVDHTCTISLTNLDNNCNYDPLRGDGDSCCWAGSVNTFPVQGAQISITDIFASPTGDHEYDLVTFGNPFRCRCPMGTDFFGNVTSASAPYLDIYYPEAKCTLRYRALTSPVAALLGAGPPQPGNTTTCPAGQYLETETDAASGPCLPCPPGKHSPASGSTACTPCPLGTFADGYGSVHCSRCPAGQASSDDRRAAACQWCPIDHVPAPDSRTCVPCPNNSFRSHEGTSSRCLANAYGTVCCAAGDCTGQPLCEGGPESLAQDRDTRYTATFQLTSTTLPQPACKNVTFLSCLPPDGKVSVSAWRGELGMLAYKTEFTCGKYYDSCHGHYTGTKSAYLAPAGKTPSDAGSSATYGLVSDASQGTVTMYLSRFRPALSFPTGVDEVPVRAAPECSITMKLLNGYAFDLSPPAEATCDPLDVVDTINGRQFCRPCDAGHFKNRATGACQRCPRGYYNDLPGAGSCKPCLEGYKCPHRGTTDPTGCGWGHYGSKPKQVSCLKCPANTYTNVQRHFPNTHCLPCPNGTIVLMPGIACEVPWDTTFSD